MNLYSTAQSSIQQSIEKNQEIFETLAASKTTKIERIVSTGQTSSEVYDQDNEEYVVLLQGKAKLTFVDRNETVELSSGDAIHIKAHEKHMVSYTSSDPPCIWLAIHYQWVIQWSEWNGWLQNL